MESYKSHKEQPCDGGESCGLKIIGVPKIIYCIPCQARRDAKIDASHLKRHVDKCPIGWYEGKIIRTRSTTDQDVILWLHELQELANKLVEQKSSDSDG